MPGMGSGLTADNPTIVEAFKTALLHQGLIALAILAVVAMAWQVLYMAEARRATAAAAAGQVALAGTGAGAGAGTGESVAAGGGFSPLAGAATFLSPEAPARRLLRVGFGLMWVLDGILQAQPDMPLGITTDVIKPAAITSPSWVQHLVNAGATIWSYHPIEAPAAAVWIQVGIGLWLLVAARGNWSRLAGVVAVGWALVVWVFGEAFGGIFAPGLTWLFGAPGAVLLYAAAGALVALPERSWRSPRLGRMILGIMGLFLLGMAVLQAWPGRGFWQGHLVGGKPGPVAAMASTMAGTPQPHVFSAWVAAFGSFDDAHGFAVNLFIVIALAALGVVFLAGRTRVLPYAVVAGCLLCAATWALVQDFGFFGGVGTDPNSMVPMALLFVAGYLAITKGPVPVHEDTLAPVTSLATAQSTKARLTAWRGAVARHPGYLLRSMIALGAVGIVLLGAAPMAAASINGQADPIINEATDGTPNVTNFAAKNFHLEDQQGRPVSLATLRGKTVALTFLDPVCTNDCPLIGQDFRLADGMLGSDRRNVELVAVDANPLYLDRSYLDAYDDEEGMQRLSNWVYLTGSLSALESTWNAYGVQVQYEPGGAMIGHSEITYVINGRGHVRSILQSDPGSATEAANSSFADILANTIRTVAGQR